jgi:hypothetical protein
MRSLCVSAFGYDEQVGVRGRRVEGKVLAVQIVYLRQ